MILHTVNKSPLNSACLSHCLATVDSGDAILLIEDGVYAADRHQQQLFETLPPAVELFALEADVAARGLTGRLAESVRLIDDGGFVDLSIRYEKMQSWY